MRVRERVGEREGETERGKGGEGRGGIAVLF